MQTIHLCSALINYFIAFHILTVFVIYANFDPCTCTLSSERTVNLKIEQRIRHLRLIHTFSVSETVLCHCVRRIKVEFFRRRLHFLAKARPLLILQTAREAVSAAIH